MIKLVYLFYTDFFPVFTEVSPDRFNSKLSDSAYFECEKFHKVVYKARGFKNRLALLLVND